MSRKLPSVASHPEAQQRWVGWFMLLHWLMALVVMLAVVSVFAGKFLRATQADGVLHAIHNSSGIVAFVLCAIRCAVHRRVTHPRAESRDWTDWTDWAEQGTHTLMYTLLFLLPVLGWALVNARGQDVVLCGVSLPRMIHERSPDLAYTLQDFHSSGAWILMAVMLLHVWSALWHHYLRRDGVLQSMLPTWLAPDRRD
jgi:cytochrome b561